MAESVRTGPEAGAPGRHGLPGGPETSRTWTLMGAPLDRAILRVWRPRGGSDQLPGAHIGVAWVGAVGVTVRGRTLHSSLGARIRRTLGAVCATREANSFLSKHLLSPIGFFFSKIIFDVDHF